VHDPFELYRSGVVTNPNILVLGQIGRGKSAFVKTYCYRHAAFGRRVVVLDPKGEYGPLAEGLGATPITLAPGGPIRLNPLSGPSDPHAGAGEIRRMRIEILGAVVEACLERRCTPTERVACEGALDEVAGGSVTLPAVAAALLDPAPGRAAALGVPLGVLRRAGREVGLELRRLITGDLAGMFDGESSPGVDLGASVVVLDLSALYRSSALGVVLACARGALEVAFRSGDALQTVLVIDEAWAVLANAGAARFLQSSFKLARAYGVANVAVVHRISDLFGAGESGSAARAIAQGLLEDCETVVAYAQTASAAESAGVALGLGRRETELLTTLPRGRALWRVGHRSYLVDHLVAPGERALVDTDARLLADGGVPRRDR
jgi:type IV secretory pathway VirB4 component